MVLPVIADWVLTIPIVPFKGPLEFITSLNSFWVSIIAAFIGIVAGLFFHNIFSLKFFKCSFLIKT